MALKTIDGILLKDMIASGAALLEKNRQAVDQLNVFPVPDGDTGTNMSQTMNSAVREMNGRDLVMAGEILQAVARGALKGAHAATRALFCPRYCAALPRPARARKMSTRRFCAICC